ncbi:hypothetical protein B0H14DRAFT_3161467 [Mycena olivaceomarginata]|nr:hypothetical protein B0H14DRAFT_3161467 [Mycena olivaceomarginata]
MGDAILSAHEIDVSFFRDKPNARGNIYYHTSEGTPFLANFIAEIGLTTDANSRSHRMVLALRCPTGAPEGLCSMFQNGAAVYDALRVSDETEEAKNGENFELTECVECSGDSVEDIVVLARLEPTYEHASFTKMVLDSVHKQLCFVRSSYSSQENYQGGLDHGNIREQFADHILERKVGDTYPPSVLSDHRGPCFAHDKAVVTQRDYTDAEGNLIAPAELYSTLVEGTLVLVTVYFATYIMKDQKNDRGEPQPDRKVYHLIVDKLKPKKRARDNAVDTAFNNFGKASPSSSKRQKRNTTGTQ